MPTIRIDDEVYEWLKSQAIPFEDNPNTVLRRVANMDQERTSKTTQAHASRSEALTSAKELCAKWNITVSHALYHRDGTFYENLKYFPGALLDPEGYVIFQTEEEYNNSPHLSIGQKLNVKGGISSIPGYRKAD